MSGDVTAVNTALNDNPGLVNQDPYGAGWFYKAKISNLGEVNELLGAVAYSALIGGS